MAGLRHVTSASVPADAPPEQWQRLLVDGHAPLVRARHVFRHIPSAPRCKICNNPFGGLGGRAFALAGFRPSRKNPTICSRCCDDLPAGGAEVDIAVLFADVRGSTGLGASRAPAAFAALLNRFYAAATTVLVDHDAVIDKLIGDEVMAFFVRGVSGPRYRQQAVSAGLGLLHAVGHGTAAGPWVDIGVAVHAGPAYVGNVGTAVVDFTALGDTVNVAARMQAQARPGELLLGDPLRPHAPPRSVNRLLPVQGHEPVAVLATRVDAA